MSQGDQSVANASGATVRADVNAELQALVSLSSGASAPGTTYPNQLWVDTTNAVLKRRDNANSAWMIVDTMDTDRVLSKSAGYTVQLRDMHKLIQGDTTSAGFTLTLPAVASAGEGFRFDAKNIGAGGFSLTLDGDGAEQINGSAALVLADGESALIWCDGTEWRASVVPSSSTGVPVGALIARMTSTVPGGFLECDGSAVSRTTYSALFGVIATSYGDGDGISTFNLPDLRGQFLRGYDNGAGNDPDAASRTDRGDGTTGDAVGTKQADQLKSHFHSGVLSSSTSAEGGANSRTYNQTRVNTGATGGNETRPVNISVMWCIKT